MNTIIIFTRKNLIMKKLTFSLLFLTIFCAQTFAQDSGLKFSNAREFDKNRYKDIKGSPYYFKDWVKATVHGADHSVYEDILINYNGYTESFEATNGEKWIEMNINWYRRIEVKKEGNEKSFEDLETDEVVFQRIIYPNFPDKFAVVFYEGENVQFIEEWRIAKAVNKTETPGKTEVFERFNVKRNHYLFKDGDMALVKLKPKKLFQSLGKPKQLEAFAKKEKLKLSNSNDLAKLLNHYESL